MSAQSKHVIIVAGAGPAGMAAANMLAKAGHEVIILNRDIKFGGLAEYGIFPAKLKLRGGLKKQYWEMLEQPNVHYFGNVSIGKGKDLTVDDVRSLGASAIVFAIGAQGTKAIGVEGDSAQGVFHAKDVVYHFNRLPGFGDRPFEVGKHVAVIGAGDVMVDIAHWLIRYKKVERVTAIVRRGPLERKYNPKEIRSVCANMDLDGITKEVARIKDRLAAVGQNASPRSARPKWASNFLRRLNASWSIATIECAAWRWKTTNWSPREPIPRQSDSSSITNSPATPSSSPWAIKSTRR
jgi:ferredoxin/flavodoxin---NADP+ reductase